MNCDVPVTLVTVAIGCHSTRLVEASTRYTSPAEPTTPKHTSPFASHVTSPILSPVGVEDTRSTHAASWPIDTLSSLEYSHRNTWLPAGMPKLCGCQSTSPERFACSIPP